MPTSIAMPKLGMTMREGKVVEWPVPLGAQVEKGQIVLIIESEKAEIEIEATGSGYFRHIYVDVDETVPCGSLLAVLTESPDDAFDVEQYHDENHQPEEEKSPAAPTPAPASTPPMQTATATARSGKRAVTPAARKRAKELDVDVAQVQGTGPGGRVTREDVDAYSAARESLTEVDEGVSLEVLRAGEGPGICLLPGFGTDVSAFTRQIPALTPAYSVHGVNPRGVGLSDAPELDCYEVARAADDVAQIAVAPMHILGTSLGAATALELAIRHPGKVRSLTLVAPFIRTNGRLLAVIDAWCALARSDDGDGLARSLLPWLFSLEYLGDEATRERTVTGLAATLARAPAETLMRSAEGLRRWSGTRADDLEKIAAPTLVITGAGDLLTPDGSDVGRAIPGASVIEIPVAGHALGLEAPESVNEAILAHLSAS